MDKRHKSALRKVRTDFCDDLALGPKFYAELIKEKIFIEEQIEQIKAQPTTCDQVNKLFDLLPKRGPEAFEKFLTLVRKDHSWLADALENNVEKVSPGNQIKQLPSNSHEKLNEHKQTQEITNTNLTTAAAFNGTHTDTNKKFNDRSSSPIKTVEPKNRSDNEVQTEEGLFATADDKAINEGDVSKTPSHPAESTDIESLKKDDVNNTHTALPWNKQVQMEAMKQLYTKVIGITSQHSENEESKDVTWEHINCGVDKLAEMLRNFDDSKILYKCYEILPSQTSRQPLNQILQGLLAEKENLQKEVKKGYEDAYEAYKEKSMLKKNHQQNLVQVKKNYEASLNAEKKTYQEKIEEKNKKIGELEKKVEELQAENARHLICKHRKTPKYIQTPQSQTPRKNVPKQISFTQSKISQVKKK